MATWIGEVKAGGPTIKLTIGGISDELSREFEVLVDTGFSGFISLPITSAFPLGVLLVGDGTSVLADGSTSSNMTAAGHARMGAEKQAGILILHRGASSEILVGMEFLRAFKKTLILYGSAVLLVDDSDADQFVNALQKALEQGA